MGFLESMQSLRLVIATQSAAHLCYMFIQFLICNKHNFETGIQIACVMGYSQTSKVKLRIAFVQP